MITYELALELKKAGFAPSRSELIKWPADVTDCDMDARNYAPGLSELIDACIEAKEGNNEFALFFFDRSTCWWADIGNSSPVMLGEVQGEFRGEGTTKEEAVARLWLALKVKP